MAGIFDLLGGMNPEQNQGLLAAATQVLRNSGPGRPYTFGNGLGDAIGAYQGNMQQQQQRKMLEQRFAQEQQLNDYALRDKKSDYEAQEAQRARAKNLIALSAAYQKTRGGGQQQSAAPVDRSAAAMMQSLAGGGMPQMEAPGAPMPGGMPGAGQAQGGGNNRSALVQQRLDYAQHLRDNGYGAEAQAEEDSAMKLQPKVKGWEKVQVNGKVMFAPFFEDGSNGQPVPLEVAEKLDAINRGGSTDLVNQYTGATVRSLTNSVSPDAALSAATQRRGQDITARGQSMVDARTREQNAISNQANALKLQDKMDTRDMTKASQIASFDTMLGTLDRLKTHGGLPRSVGLYSKVPTMPGSDSANFQAELETFKSQAFIPMVAQLKGMGALSDAEGKKLTAAVGALDPSMSESAFKASIDRVIADMNGARQRVSGGRGAAPAASAAASIPQAAANHLKMNPKLREQFDAKYGAGAAASVLGQ